MYFRIDFNHESEVVTSSPVFAPKLSFLSKKATHLIQVVICSGVII